jgi:hypothetical protein
MRLTPQSLPSTETNRRRRSKPASWCVKRRAHMCRYALVDLLVGGGTLLVGIVSAWSIS